MKTKLSRFSTLAFFALLQPLSTMAQQAPPADSPPYGYGPGQWHMWAGGWGMWWWICLLVFLIVFGIVMFVIGRRCGQRPDRPGGDRTA